MEFSQPVFSSLSEFMQYIASLSDDGDGRVPPLSELSQILGISVATLREQLEVARMMGVVEVKPKAGIHKLAYSFKPAVITSLTYALASESTSFEQYANLRKHLEATYFLEAAQSLLPEDKRELESVVLRAEEKLKRRPINIPTGEHREFHLLIYRRLNNPYVIGLLEAYWDLYKAAGFEIYPDLEYVNRIWVYHRKTIEFIKDRHYDLAQQALLEHMELIGLREKKVPRQSFE
ncbi:MAG: FadR/GntR family transcriptional regulator [Anaerolineaceae bacterium]